MSIHLVFLPINNNEREIRPFTPVSLKGLRLIATVETPSGDLLTLEPDELGPHPGCYRPDDCLVEKGKAEAYAHCVNCVEVGSQPLITLGSLTVDLLCNISHQLENIKHHLLLGDGNEND